MKKEFLYKKIMHNTKSNNFFKAVNFSLVLVSLTSCNFVFNNSNNKENIDAPIRWTKDEDKMLVNKNGIDGFYAADGYSNGNMFNCIWRKNNISFNDGVMSMTVNKSKNGYDGSEYRSWKDFSYGYFSVSMKAASCSGVISSFFTYTGNPWDEIDIEFLGKDTTKVQFNYYTKGQGGHEFYYDLGFDASESFHEYGFDWKEDALTWYVDGTPVHQAKENIPSTSANLMANVWNGKGETFDNWCGALDESKLPISAQYEWFAYSSNN